jgi:S-adenosylmethionine:tRNA ribosyltransferase-isomerase
VSTATAIEPGGAVGLHAAPTEDLWAREPPEARGVARDGVRLMVTHARTDRVEHAVFRELPRLLHSGDVLVVNASATVPAALDADWIAGLGWRKRVALHLSTPLPGGSPEHWVVELRAVTDAGTTAPLLTAKTGDALHFAEAGSGRLLEPYRRAAEGRSRLWVARLKLPGGVLPFAERHGRPIRYRYVPRVWPLSDYQTVFAAESGSAEMPSAGRPFTDSVVASLGRAGVIVAPLTLHTGVASLEADEPPYPERYSVSRETAHAVNAARERGSRVIAVGTTVVRALETVASPGGRVHAGAGWTDLVVNPARGVRAVDGVLTGLHDPTSSHLSMLSAFAGRRHLGVAYRAALDERYLWHEFGDVHLMLR